MKALSEYHMHITDDDDDDDNDDVHCRALCYGYR